MINEIFLVQLLVTFTVGSVWIFLVTTTAKRFGSKVGGFIGGLPSTALLSFFFIGYTQSPEIASQAATVFPGAYGVTAIFLIVFAWLINYGLFFSLFYSLLSWFVLTISYSYLDSSNFALNLSIYTVLVFFSFFILMYKLKIVSKSKSSINYSLKQYIFRSLFGGFIIMGAVFFAKIGGPLYGGIFAAFPAMFITTLVISHGMFGSEFSRAITKPLMITGMITVVVYAISVKYFYLNVGLYWGTFISIVISGISAFFTLRFIQRKLI